MPTATMTSKGQITIPKEIRDRLDLRAGDRVRFVLREDRVVEMRAKTLDIRKLKGMLKVPPGQKPMTVEAIDEAIADAVDELYRKSVE